jgi:hypothetical protein
MKKINCDGLRVNEAIEKAQKLEKDVRIKVWDIACVMRGISDNEMEERNIPKEIDNIICTIELEWFDSMDKYSPTGKLKFHEKSVENEFTLNPVGIGHIDPQQATLPKDLSYNLQLVQEQIDYKFNSIWDFSKVNGASYANGGYITDYEFEYEFTI